MARILAFLAAIVAAILSINFVKNLNNNQIVSTVRDLSSVPSPPPAGLLNIQYLKSQNYQGSDIKIEQTLSPGSNYTRYIVSFVSDNLKEYAYLTVPEGTKPSGGWPVIIFNHGYQVPELYTPDGNYIAYMDSLAKAGFIIFKPDFRGNGKSQGMPGSSYFSANYAVDDLNAIASIKKFKDANRDKIGIWGHSMGGNITLRVSEVSKDIKVAVIWGGVVGDYNDIIYNWQDKVSYKPASEDLYLRNLGLSDLLATYGTPIQDPDFWNSIDPTANLNLISVPFQIHVGLADNQVPPTFSKNLYDKLVAAKKTAEYYEYPGANHDIAEGFSLATQRTIDFFNRYLK